MSLCLGKIGRRIVKSSLKPTTIGRTIGKAADGIGKALSFISRHRYKIGLTRLAYRISEQLMVGEIITILDGKILKEDGSIIAENKLLEVGKEMGQTQVREPLNTPEGMANFLRYIYLVPKRWGIHFSEKFSLLQKKLMEEQMLDIDRKLGIKKDLSFSLFIRPFKYATKFFENKLDILLDLYILAYGFRTALSLIGTDEYVPDFSDIISLLIFYRSFASKLTTILIGGEYFPIRNKGYEVFNNSRATIALRTDEELLGNTFPHEYIHSLHDQGLIQNDIIAEAVSCLIMKGLTGEIIEQRKKDYECGLKTDPLSFILTTKVSYSAEWDNLIKNCYNIGNRLAGIADQLAEKSGNSEDKWRFLRLVSRHKDNKQLLKDLQDDPKFRDFFTPSENVDS